MILEFVSRNHGNVFIVFIDAISILVFLFSFVDSPWYNRNGWLGVKHQVTYLLIHLILRCMFW